MPDSDLEHQTLHFLAQLETVEPTEAEGDVMGTNEDGRELNCIEAGSGPGAMRKLRSLLPWTAVREHFLGLASFRDH